jgi:hypothetical protein
MAKKPPSEIPPSENPPMYCSESGCSEDVYGKGLCEKHYLAKFKAKGRKPEPSPPVSASTILGSLPGKKVERKDVETMVLVTMQFLAATVDESFDAAELIHDKDGKVVAVVIRPHIEKAVDQMMPWFEIYGPQFVKLFPWFGLAGGIITLSMPAIDPVTEIIAGVRTPRCFRKGKDPYTAAYHEAMRRKAAGGVQTEEKKPPVTIVHEQPNADDNLG